MPPKVVKKQEIISEDDGSGMPKQIVQFKWEFEVVQNNIQNTAIVFEWFANSNQIEKSDTGLIEAWAPKGTENANALVYDKSFESIRVDQETVQQLCQRKFNIYVINTDDMKIKQEIELDLGCLVTDRREQPEFIYENHKMKIMEVEYLRLRISADKPLLQQLFREFLNPLEITIIGAKDIPIQINRNYEPVYASYKFFDGTIVQTPSIQQANKIRWDYTHVHLMGHLDQQALKEQLSTKPLLVQLHDRDELLDNTIRIEQDLFDIDKWLRVEAEKDKPKETEPIDPKKKGSKDNKKDPPAPATKKEAPKKDSKKKDVKIGEPIREPQVIGEYNRNNYGIAAFFLTDLLKPSFRATKLQSGVVPKKQFEDLESNNLELNTTAKKNMEKIQSSTNYMDMVYLNIYSIQINQELFFIDSNRYFYRYWTLQAPNQLTRANCSRGIGKEGVKIAGRAFRFKEHINQTAGKQYISFFSHKNIQVNLPPIFERAIFIMPYKQRVWVQRLQQWFYDVNMRCFPQAEGGVRALTTKALTDRDKFSRELDYISGFEIIDSEIRIFVFEGLGNGAMKLLMDVIPRDTPNTDTLKILKNHEVRFKERIYTDFNVEIKRIRLRENLSKLLINPDLYIRTKVPENIQDTLVKLSNILCQWNIRTVSQFNLFPVSIDLIAVERKYSDSLNNEDTTGNEPVIKSKKKTATIQENNTAVSNNYIDRTKSNYTISQTNPNIQDIQQTEQLQQLQQQQQQQQQQLQQQQQQQTISLPNIQQEKEKQTSKDQNNHQQQMRKYRDQALVSHSVTLNGQKNNDLQEERKRLRQDKEAKLLESNRPQFRTISARPPGTFNQHPKKPPQCVLDELSNERFYEQQQLREQIKRPVKQLRAFPNNEKKEFNEYIGQIGIFSLPEIKEELILSPVQREKQLQEQKKLEQSEFKAKCLGPTFFYTKSRALESSDQIDKNKGLLEDIAIKKGLLITNQQIQNSKIQLTRRLEHPPSSIFSQDPFTLPVDPFSKILDPSKVVANQPFNNNLEPEYLTKTSVHKILKNQPY